MICKRCGENLPDNARVCFTCSARVSKDGMPLPEVVQPEPLDQSKLSAGEFFNLIFSSKRFYAIAVLLTLLSAFLVAAVIVAVAVPGVDIDVNIGNAFGTASLLMMTALAWSLCIKARKKPLRQEFRTLFMLCRYYVFVRLAAVIIQVAFDIFSADASGNLTVGAAIDWFIELVIGILPLYAAYLMARSMQEGAESGFLKLEGTTTLIVYSVLVCIIYILDVPWYIVASIKYPVFTIVLFVAVLEIVLAAFCYSWLNKMARIAKNSRQNAINSL